MGVLSYGWFAVGGGFVARGVCDCSVVVRIWYSTLLGEVVATKLGGTKPIFILTIYEDKFDYNSS